MDGRFTVLTAHRTGVSHQTQSKEPCDHHQHAPADAARAASPGPG
jgi:hypothetical protein